MGFVWLQTPGLFDRGILEWDARALPLCAYRFHGTGMFARDLGMDAAARYGTPLWTAIYWVGTLFTDPLMVSKLLPFALFAVVVWQSYALGRELGGPVTGALCVVSVVHCSFIWNRLAGGHSRGFGFPLVIALMRYAVCSKERRALALLILQGLAYPSALLCCGPAYAVVAWQRGRGPFVRAVIASAIGIACAGASLWHDPKLGGAPSYAQAAGLRQMQIGAAQPYYPLPPLASSLVGVALQPFRADGDSWHGVRVANVVGLAILAVAAVGALLRSAAIPNGAIFVALPLCGLLSALAAQLLAYRLYLPDRMLQLGIIPVALLALPVLATQALASPMRAALLVSVMTFGIGGDGLPLAENLTDCRRHETPAMRFVATLPPDTLIATHAERSTYVQLFAKRPVLFSAAINVPFLYDYAVEIDQRMEAFYRAYYARTPEEVAALRVRYAVDYVIVDTRDFGSDAVRRAKYFEPWGTLTAKLLAGVDASTLALAHPPQSAIVFEGENQRVVDLRAYSGALR